MSRSLLVLLVAALLTACGQKGPLYMPAKPPAAAATAPAAPADDVSTQEKKDKVLPATGPATKPATAPAAN